MKQILIGMSKPFYPPTFVATAKLMEFTHSTPYRRFISYPVYILVTECGELKGCTLTDATEIDNGLDDDSDDDDVMEIDADIVNHNEDDDKDEQDEAVMNAIPEIDANSVEPNIM